MIRFNPGTRASNPLLRIWYYAFQVDRADRVMHPGWGPRPTDTAQNDRISGAAAYKIYAATFASRRADRGGDHGVHFTFEAGLLFRSSSPSSGTTGMRATPSHSP